MSVIRQSQQRATSATTGSRYRPRKDIAVDSTPLRSFSDLLRSSLAALAITGCGPASPRCAVLIMAASVVSIGRLGSDRSEEHTSELQSLMRISYAVFCL